MVTWSHHIHSVSVLGLTDSPSDVPRLCGYPPFYDESDAVLFELIMKGKFDFDERYWHEVSADAKDLIKHMLIVDPVKRFTTYQVLAHPWITGVARLPRVNLSKSISMNLKKRGSNTTPFHGGAAVQAAPAPAAPEPAARPPPPSGPAPRPGHAAAPAARNYTHQSTL